METIISCLALMLVFLLAFGMYLITEKLKKHIKSENEFNKDVIDTLKIHGKYDDALLARIQKLEEMEMRRQQRNVDNIAKTCADCYNKDKLN